MKLVIWVLILLVSLIPQANSSQLRALRQARPDILASGMNSKGDITGYYVRADGSVTGFIRFANGTFVSNDAPGAGPASGQGTLPAGINDDGEVAGTYIDSNFVAHGFLRLKDGTFTVIDIPHSVDEPGLWKRHMAEKDIQNGKIEVRGINKNREIIGSYRSISERNGFLRKRDGSIVVLHPSTCRATEPQGINDLGNTVGVCSDANSVQHGFLRSNKGEITLFDAPEAGLGTVPESINNQGEIAGYFVTSDSRRHGFLRERDGMFTGFIFPNARSTTPYSISDSGEIVGSYDEFRPTMMRSFSHGFLRQKNGNFISVDVPGVLDSTDTDARIVNDQGQIAGIFTIVGPFGDGVSGLASTSHVFLRQRDGHFVTVDLPGTLNAQVEEKWLNPFTIGSPATRRIVTH